MRGASICADYFGLNQLGLDHSLLGERNIKSYTPHQNVYPELSSATMSAQPRASYPTTANALLRTCSKEWYLMLSLMNP